MSDYDFSPAVIGKTCDGCDVLDIDLMIEVLMGSGDFEDSIEAEDYIGWNASFSTPANEKPVVILYQNAEGMTGSEYVKEHDIDDAYVVECLDSAFVGISHGGVLCYDFAASINDIKARLKCDEKTACKVLRDIIIPMSKSTSLNEPIFICK